MRKELKPHAQLLPVDGYSPQAALVGQKRVAKVKGGYRAPTWGDGDKMNGRKVNTCMPLMQQCGGDGGGLGEKDNKE